MAHFDINPSINLNAVELKRIAFRNLARHKVKTILTVLGIMISVTLYIFMDGWITGASAESRRNIVNYEQGAAKLQTKQYFEKKDEFPMYESFDHGEFYAAALDKAGYDSAPRFVFSGTLYSATGSAPIMFNGVSPASERRLLRYTPYVESGRYIQEGAFELALGALAAEKLKVGIPQRLTRGELEQDILPIAPHQDQDFIRSLYEPVEKKKSGFMNPMTEEDIAAQEDRMILKKEIPPAELARYWDILDAAGRNDVRISTVIDIKAAPDAVSKTKFEVDLAPVLDASELALFHQAYEYDELTEAYYLASAVLSNQIQIAMVRVGYAGAIRHVNQLMSAKVVGLINSPDPMTNANIAYMPLDVLQDEAGLMLEGHVTELLIRQKNAPDAKLPGKNESAPRIQAALEAGLAEQGAALADNLAVFSWQDYLADYLGYENTENMSDRIIALLLFILAFMGIANTMLLAILERTKEIGMMRALGMTDGQLIFTYMMEAGFVGLIGSLLGIFAGCCINIPMVKYGLDISVMAEQMGGNIGYRVSSQMRSMWNLPVIIGSGVVATLLASLMAIFPTRRAVKMPVTESLRFE
ncbi:MAG: FtsX-like permease family protein [Treponema sp.]|jgi:ABC-type lipoprotein release transport system permease subunit|nr:FtsX-like permease family protein [Treponema sp.]